MKRMPLGKLRGLKIKDLPDEYLAWLLTIELRQSLFDAVHSEWSARCRGERRQFEVVRFEVAPSDVPLVRDLIEQGRRGLAKKFHPDAGGDDQAMTRVNVLAD